MIDWLFSKSKDILLFLLESDNKNLKEIQQGIGGSFSTIDKHLMMLKEYNLIEERKEPNKSPDGRIIVGYSRIFSLTNKGKIVAEKLKEIDKQIAEIKEILEEE